MSLISSILSCCGSIFRTKEDIKLEGLLLSKLNYKPRYVYSWSLSKWLSYDEWYIIKCNQGYQYDVQQTGYNQLTDYLNSLASYQSWGSQTNVWSPYFDNNCLDCHIGLCMKHR